MYNVDIFSKTGWELVKVSDKPYFSLYGFPFALWSNQLGEPSISFEKIALFVREDGFSVGPAYTRYIIDGT